MKIEQEMSPHSSCNANTKFTGKDVQEGGERPVKKSAATFVLLILDVALLLMILLWPEKTSQSVIADTITPPGPVQEETPPAETEETEETEPVSETTEQESEDEVIPAVSAFSTRERPHIRDFKWITEEIRAGICPDEAESFSFEESLGGWKCYLVDDGMGVERLANMELSGSGDDIGVLFDWYYTRINKDEDFEDNSPDSVFRGHVTEEGEVDAEGPGRLRLTDIYRIGDHQYAFGNISWPDGMNDRIYLIRP